MVGWTYNRKPIMREVLLSPNNKARLQRMRAISERCARLLRKAGPPVDHGDLLYDERGLPRAD